MDLCTILKKRHNCLFSYRFMKQTAIIILAIGLFTACNKKEATFCYTCTQKFVYPAKDSIPTHSEIKTTQYCDQTYEDIVSLKQQNGGETTASYTSYALECVRQQ